MKKYAWLLGVTVLALGGGAVAQTSPPAAPPAATPSVGCPCAGRMGMRMGRGGGMACPLVGSNVNEVRVENTKDGAVIRLTTKDSASVASLQQRASQVASCWSRAAQPSSPPASK